MLERPAVPLRAAWMVLSMRASLLAEVPFVASVLVFALIIRLKFILAHDFPLNDGGMFYSMVRDIQNVGYVLPTYASYNGQNIPFAYPPLALYIAAFLDGFTPFHLLDILRFLPMVLSLLVVVAVYLLARAMLSSKLAAGFALVFYILMPRSHAWLIVGGGLTRATALLFAVLALLAAYKFFTSRRFTYLWAVVPLAALSVLSHPEIGWFTVFSLFLFFLFYGRHRPGVIGLAITGLGVLVLSAPWWGAVVLRHGLDPVLAAARTGSHNDLKSFLLSLVQLRYTEEGAIPLLGALGIVGLFPAIAGRFYILPIWLVAMFVLEPRSAATYATIPLSMMIGLLFARLVVPLVPWRDLFRRTGRSLEEDLADGAGSVRALRSLWLSWRPDLSHWLAAGATLLAFSYVLFLAYGTARSSNAQVLEAISPEDQKAMQWVAENTPPDSRFLVLTYQYWADDQVTEWFPALTGRKSLSTAQGKEWLRGLPFADAIGRHDNLAVCSFQDVGCLERWSVQEGLHYDYVYTSADCCSAELAQSLRNALEYKLIYGDGVVRIWKYERVGV